MSSYDDTDALVPPGVRVLRRPGITLISTPAAGPSVSPPPAPPPTPAQPAPAPALHPVQPQPASTDALVPPGVRVPERPGIVLIPTPLSGTSVSGAKQSQLGAGVPQSSTDALVPRGVNVPRRPGITLLSVSAAGPGIALRKLAGLPADVPLPPGDPQWIEGAKNVIDEIASPNPAQDAFAVQFIRKYWSGPQFTAADLKKAAARIKWQSVFHSLRQEPTNDSIAKLYAYAVGLAKQANTPQRRAELSAAIFVLYTTTSGSVGGGDPGLPNWGPRP